MPRGMPRELSAEEYRRLIDRQMPEAALLAKVRDLATLEGWLCFHDVATNAPRTCPWCHAPIRLPRNPPGFPDLVLARFGPEGTGRLLFAELKSERGRSRDGQDAWALSLLSAGADFRLWRPSAWEEIERTLKGEG